MLFYGSVILTTLTIIENKRELDTNMTVTPSYLKEHRVPDGSRLTLVSFEVKQSGIVKPDSIQMKPGTLEHRFVVTDFKNEIEVIYKGAVPRAFKQGDMAIMGGFVSDPRTAKKFIATNVTANHEIGFNRYTGKTALEKSASLAEAKRKGGTSSLDFVKIA